MRLVVGLLAGCGRVGFDVPAPNPCWAQWLAHDVTIDDVRRVDELGDGQTEDPSLAPGGLEMFFMFTTQLRTATRASTRSPWIAQPVIDSLRSDGGEERLTLVLDGSAVFGSDRTGSAQADLWFTMRDADGSFASPEQATTAALNTPGTEKNPELSPDGRTLFYAAPSPPRIMQSVREGVFLAPTVVIDPAPLRAADPTVSPDQRVVVFSAAAFASPDFDLYFATRGSPGEPFGPPILIDGVNSLAIEVDAELSEDGCELYYRRDTEGIHVATLVAP